MFRFHLKCIISVLTPTSTLKKSIDVWSWNNNLSNMTTYTFCSFLSSSMSENVLMQELLNVRQENHCRQNSYKTMLKCHIKQPGFSSKHTWSNWVSCSKHLKNDWISEQTLFQSVIECRLIRQCRFQLFVFHNLHLIQ